jgi:DNA-binding NarL/FixJ family response regulator
MSRSIRILIVDDHTLLRESLAVRLRSEPDLDVVDTVADAEQAIRKAESHRPDIVLLDINMPGVDGFDAAARMSRVVPDVRIVFLSAYCNDHFVEQAVRVKAKGYLTKTESPDRLIEALRSVANGESIFSSDVAERLSRIRATEPANGNHDAPAHLTRREHEVLRYIALGLTRREMAETMHISTKTVAAHTSSLMAKLGLHDRVALARYAIRRGLVEP